MSLLKLSLKKSSKDKEEKESNRSSLTSSKGKDLRSSGASATTVNINQQILDNLIKIQQLFKASNVPDSDLQEWTRTVEDMLLHWKVKLCDQR